MNSFEIMDGTWQVVLAQAGATLEQGQPVNVPGTPGGLSATESSTGQLGGSQSGSNSSKTGFPPMLMLVMVFFVVMIFMTSMGGRRDRKRQASMLAGLTKQDKIKTSGGIIGTIVEIHGEELVIRTDESSNTRIRMSRGSIQQVLKPSRDRGGGTDLSTLESKPKENATV